MFLRPLLQILHYRIKKVRPLDYKIAHLILLSTNPWPSLVSSPAFHTRLWVRGLVHIEYVAISLSVYHICLRCCSRLLGFRLCCTSNTTSSSRPQDEYFDFSRGVSTAEGWYGHRWPEKSCLPLKAMRRARSVFGALRFRCCLESRPAQLAPWPMLFRLKTSFYRLQSTVKTAFTPDDSPKRVVMGRRLRITKPRSVKSAPELNLNWS